MANTKLPARLLDTSAVPTLNVTGTTTANGNVVVVGSELRVQRPSGGSSYFGILMDSGEKVRLRNSYANKDIYFDRDGNLSIGVGTAADGAHFQHYQSSARHQSFQSTNGDLAIVTDNNTNPAVYIKGTGTADLVKVLDNTTEVFKIADGGNVTIGGGVAATSDSGGHAAYGLNWQNSAIALRMMYDANYFMSIETHAQTRDLIFNNKAGDGTGDIRFRTDNATGTLNDRLVITAAGYVGVGSIGPSAALHVSGDMGNSTSAVLRIRGTNSTARTTRLQFEDYSGAIADGLIDFVIPNAGSTTGAYLGMGFNSSSQL